MKYITNRIKIHFLLAITAMVFLVSCNKDLEQIAGPAVIVPTGLALGETIASIPNDSLYYKLIIRGGMLSLINKKTSGKDSVFTMFVPDNIAMRNFMNLISNGATVGYTDPQYVAFINTAISASTAASIVSYNMIPQAITTASIPNTFPNWFYPSHLNPTTGTPGFNPLVRLTTSLSTRNGNWVNNVPLTAVNTTAYNGIIHTASGMVPAPPQRAMWARITADTDMDYFEAAVQRADSGIAQTTSASLVWVLNNFGPNVNVFVPTDAAFETVLTGQITLYLISQGVPPPTAAATAAALIALYGPTIFSQPLVANVLTPTTVKGIVVYHMMGARAFLNNFPTTATSYPTLLNGGIPTHPGVSLVATFTGGFVSAASVKGVANTTPSNIIMNALPFLPDPAGTSDQHFINGTLHKINQVLLPQ